MSTAHAGVEFCPDLPIGRTLPDADGIRIVSPAVDGLRANDVALQLNGRGLLSCDDLISALDQAREQGLRLLFLVRRGEETIPVVVTLAEPDVAQTPASTPVPTPAADLDATTAAEVRQACDDLASFGRGLAARLPLPASQSLVQQMADVTDKYERRIAALPGLQVIRPILGYYDTAGKILAHKLNASTQQGTSVRHINPVLEYQSNSAFAEWLREYPFLAASVRDKPEEVSFLTRAERAGHWSPDDAVQLLIERAVADAEALSARVGTASDADPRGTTPASDPQT